MGVCGEAAGDPLLALVLVGLGLTSLSMDPACLPSVRHALSTHTLDRCREMAQAVLDADDAPSARADVRRLAAPSSSLSCEWVTMQRYVVCLQCHRCGSERAHAVVYLGTIIACITCSECGSVVAPRPDVLLERYLRDFEVRLADKPGKMLRRATQHPVDFLFHYLPLGLIRKPGEILREWKVLARASSAGTARTAGCAEPRRPWTEGSG